MLRMSRCAELDCSSCGAYFLRVDRVRPALAESVAEGLMSAGAKRTIITEIK